MKKRLLTKDYVKIMTEAYLLPQKDWHNYYANKIEKYYQDNNNIFRELKVVIDADKNWHWKQAHGGLVKVEMKDGSIEWLDRNQTFEHDSDGVISLHDLNENEIWLLPLTSVGNVRVNKAFFDKHLELIEWFEKIVNLRSSVIEFERQLPEILRKSLATIPFPFSTDHDIIKKRSDLITYGFKAYESENEKMTNELNNIVKQLKSEPPNQLSPDLTDTQRSLLYDLLKNWILPDSIDKFIEIENELINRGYIDNHYKWQKENTKIALTEFVCVIDHFRLFKPIVNGKRIKNFHKRQFISERYGFGKTGLSETWKKTKPTIENSLVTYFWVKPLFKSPVY